ncbi:DnaJ domain-containing protein [Acinetobacter baumannii]|uniref:J domain-containing protein n=1 Tax=Acinetobacter baumannii TaxID=470 RepID=UPI0013D83112|nr:J domain-containing protein [Acinetobacter baumannii]
MTLYEVLHVAPDAPVEIIKLAYKGLAQKYHPDRYKGDDANEIMVKIREAYETLIDPEKRKNYDQFLAEQARRKQQQEEYVKKQQQEEFIRAQKAAFERQNKTSSSSNTQHEQQPQNKDSKSFKMNISIDVPNSFSIFSPFIKLKNWLISKKRVFIQIGGILIGLGVLITIGAIATSYVNNLPNNNYAQAQADAEAAAQEAVEEAEQTVQEENMAAEQAMSAASEAVAAAEEAERYSEYGTTAPTENSDNQAENIDELLVTKQDLEKTVNLVMDTFEQHGMDGVRDLVSNCYQNYSTSRMCIYFDVTASYIHESGVSTGLPEYPYFNSDSIINRVNSNFYEPNRIESHIGEGHFSVVFKRIGEVIEERLNNLDSDRS